jgi:pre-mRNA-processing factor 39
MSECVVINGLKNGDDVDSDSDGPSPTKKPMLEEEEMLEGMLNEGEEEKMEEEILVLPELEKFWKAVQADPNDFTAWTQLLQYVDQEVSYSF